MASCKKIRIPDCWWNLESWALEYGIQLKESGIPLTIGIRNGNSSDKESGIQSPRRGIQNPRLSWIPLLGAKVENISSNHRKQALHGGRKLRGTLDVLQKDLVNFVKLNKLNQNQSKYFG